MKEAVFHSPNGRPLRDHPFHRGSQLSEEGVVFPKAKGDHISVNPQDISDKELAVLQVLRRSGENGLNSLQIKNALKGTEFPIEIRDVPGLVQSLRRRFGEGVIVFEEGNYEFVLEMAESFPERVRNVLGIDSE